MSDKYLSSIKNIAAWFFAVSSLLLFALLPLHFTPLHRIALVLFFASFVLDYVINTRWRTRKPDMSYFFYACMVLYFLLMFIYLPVEQDSRYISNICESRLPFLGFGIIGLLGGFNDKFKAGYFACTGAIASLIYIAYVIYAMGGWESLMADNAFLQYQKAQATNINAHMAINSYYIAVIALTYFMVKDWRTTDGNIKKFATWFCAISCIILAFFLIKNEGRMGLLMLSVMLFYIVADLLKKKRIFLILGMVVFLLIAVMFAATRPRFNTDLVSANPRLQIWDATMELIEERPLSGYGSSTAYAKMSDDFKEIQWHHDSDRNFLLGLINNGDYWAAHAHNQLLQSWLEFGIIGVLLMAAIFISPFVAMNVNKFYPLFAIFLLCIIMQLQTDIIRGSIGYIGFCFYFMLALNLQGTRNLKVKGKGEKKKGTDTAVKTS